MITKFSVFSGLFSVELDKGRVSLRLSYDENLIPFKVDLVFEDEKYDELSIIIPDSDELDKKEFFMNPKIDKRIIETLLDEGFIDETGKESIAGEYDVKSYEVII